MTIIMRNKLTEDQQLSETTSARSCSSSHRLAPGVLLVTRDTSTVVMDFDRGRFFGLDAIGSQMLSKTLTHGPIAAAAAIAPLYAVDSSEVCHDLAGLLSSLRELGLVHGPGYTHSSAGWRVAILSRALFGSVLSFAIKLIYRVSRKPSDASATAAVLPGPRSLDLLLFLAWLSIRLLGWNGAMALWRCDRAAGVPRPASIHDVASLVDNSVCESASRQVFLGLACKERSLLGLHLLRFWNGLPAAVVIGVDFHPFRAHAWVECFGLVVTDDPSHCQLYSPVIRYE